MGFTGTEAMSVHDGPPKCQLRPSPMQVSDLPSLNERTIDFSIPTEKKVVPENFEAVRIEDIRPRLLN